ncbi:MAG: TlpA disulfide reductase family protein [Paludibacter sp.]|nr:TlpA disulfide reductase family protein [Paludibacter sp.]
MKKLLIVSLALLGLFACNSKDKFKVEGVVENSDKQVLYLEHTGLDKTVILDSIKLRKEGKYAFKAPRPAYPDFYRLRTGNQFITFAIDSCEIITINADAKNFSTEYTVEGSQTNVDIQQLRKSVHAIQQKVNALSPDLSTSDKNEKIAEIEVDIENHKEVARKLILQNPRSSAAYFALFQQINNTYIFSPYIKSDKPYCAAVATSYNAFMPESPRTRNIYNLVMDAIKTERQAKQKEAWKEIIEKSGTGFIDIELNDRNNTLKKLSDLQGKVILVDFSAYESEKSVQYTFALRDLYNKYHAKGLEIFQVSLDRNKFLWEESTTNIPWICVHDENGKYLSTYNISSIPTTFLIDRKGVILNRSLDFKILDKEISKLL